MSKSKRFFVTTSIPYANAGPHIGNILDPLIADVLARYRRIKGEEVRFLVGTDEHGAKIARVAEAQGKTPQELVDENSAKFKALRETLNLSWDDFIRTSDKKRHWPGAQKMWRALASSGDIYWEKYRGLYCVGHEAFITEKDLDNGKCQDHQKEPEIVEEENWFFRLSKYAKEIESKIKNGELRIMPGSRKNEILSLLEKGLEDVSFSRPSKDLSWGIPVPNDPTQIMYVWSDALVSYISAIGYGQENHLPVTSYQYWWPADWQIVGKDNLRFHAAIWPGMLLSAGLELPKAIFVHGFVNVDGKKISKTVGNVIAPEEVVGKYGIDPVRYYFLREFPAREDGDFSYRKFEGRYNGDLANGLGNLVARVAALGEKISPIHFDFKKDIDIEIKKEADRVYKNYEKYLEEVRLNEALAAIWELVSFADKYINEKKPWSISNEAELKKVIAGAAYLTGAITNLLRPFLPETAEKILEQISFVDSVIKVKKGLVLFPRLE